MPPKPRCGGGLARGRPQPLQARRAAPVVCAAAAVAATPLLNTRVREESKESKPISGEASGQGWHFRLALPWVKKTGGGGGGGGGDGRDALRQRLQQYEPSGAEQWPAAREEKLRGVLRELRREEGRYLDTFRSLDKGGFKTRFMTEANLASRREKQDLYHYLWKVTADKIEVLTTDPEQFVKRWGFLYDLE